MIDCLTTPSRSSAILVRLTVTGLHSVMAFSPRLTLASPLPIGEGIIDFSKAG